MLVAELLDYPGHEHVFEWLPQRELPSASELTAHAQAALAALAGVVQPLSATLGAACCAPGGDTLPRHFSHLRQTDLPPGVVDEPVYTPVQRQTRARLTPAVLAQWVDETLAALACGPDQQPQWQTLRVDCARARWFESASAAALVGSGGGETLPVPLLHENGAPWVAGPLAAHPDRPPVALEFSHTAGALRLTITVHWSAWTAQRPGADRLGEAMEGLLAKGWRQEDGP